MIAKRLLISLGVAGFMLVSAAVLRLAQSAGLIDQEFTRRAVQVIIGLVLAGYGNYMPKDIAYTRPTGVCATSRMQSILLFAGWSFTLAGVAYAGLWAFAPLAFANTASVVVVASAMVLTLARCAVAFTGGRPTSGPAS